MTTLSADTMIAWLATYAVHSTVLLGLTWLVLRRRRVEVGATELLWKAAMVGGLLTATAQMALRTNPLATIQLASSPAQAVSAASLGEVASDRSTRPPRVETHTANPPVVSGTVSGEAPRASVSLPQVTATGALLALWGGAALLMVLWYLGRRLILVGRLGDRRVHADGDLPDMLASLTQRAGIQRRIRLTVSNAISSPVALGRSEICLPEAALVELDPQQQRAMLAHELAHLVRHDPQWLAFACLLERAFFFQPLNRVARRGVQQSAEYLADEWAARQTGGVPLARCLVKVAEWLQSSPLGVPVAGMAEERSQLSLRVSRLLEAGAGVAPRSRRPVAVLSVLALMTTAWFAPGVSSAAEPADPSLPEQAVQETKEPRGETPPAEDGSGTRMVGAVQGNPVPTSHPAPNPAPRPDPSIPDARSELADTAVVRALMARLKDEDVEVRRAAAHALGRISDPLAIGSLVTALGDSDRNVRTAVLQALSSFDEDEKIPLVSIRKFLESKDPEERQAAIEIIADRRDAESVPSLIRLVRDSDSDIRMQAIQALCQIGDKAAAVAIAGAVTDANADVREVALQALAELEAPISDNVILAALHDADADVRDRALSIVADRRMTSMTEEVIKLLDDSNADVRECAADTLTELDNAAARAALKKALNHFDPKVRRVAVEYFGNRGN